MILANSLQVLLVVYLCSTYIVPMAAWSDVKLVHKPVKKVFGFH
jgi:hypothetical protein